MACALGILGVLLHRIITTVARGAAFTGPMPPLRKEWQSFLVRA
jgi:hypothetical protein